MSLSRRERFIRQLLRCCSKTFSKLHEIPSAPPAASRPGQSYGFSLDSDEREGQESTTKLRPGDDSRERRERPEEAQRPSWDRRTPTGDRKKKREDSEPRLFMACDDNPDTQDPLESSDKSGTHLYLILGTRNISVQGLGLLSNEVSLSLFHTDKGQATLSLGMDLNLDWMTLDDFQKHLNGEDEILSGPPLSPSKSDNYNLTDGSLSRRTILFNL